MPRRLAFASLGLLIVTATMAQLPGGGGGSGGQGPGPGATDSSPWNPANYQITKVLSGEDTVSSWIMLSGSPTLSVLVYPWVIAGQIGPEPMGAVNSTPSVRTSTMVSEGEATIQVQWIGVGPAPSKVLLRIHSGAFAGTTPTGIMEVDNGIGSPIQLSEEPSVYQSYKQQTGFKDRYVQLDGGGYGELRIDKRASASVTAAPGLVAYATARGINAYVAERAVTLSGQPNPTYRFGSVFAPGVGWVPAPVQNENKDPKDIVMDVGVTYAGILGGFAGATLLPELWGPWQSPVGVWSGTLTPTNLQPRSYTKTFTLEEITSMIAGNPQQVQDSINVIDTEDAFTDSAKSTIRFHAPWESPTWTSDVPKYSDWSPVSSYFTTNVGVSWAIQQEYGASTAVTKSVTLGLTGENLEKVHPLVQALSISFEYGETATITTNNSWTTTVAETGVPLRWRMEKRSVWREKSGFCYTYGPSGFYGVEGLTHTYWQSGSKGQAQLVDHEYRINLHPADLAAYKAWKGKPWEA